MTTDTLVDLIPDIEAIVRQAGSLLLHHRQNPPSIQFKPGKGPVSNADTHVESFLIERLAEIPISASFMAEESGRTGNGTYCWVIDPLDGTKNFIKGLPSFCISVALTYHDNPVLGIVYVPVGDECIYAVAGQGIWYNGVPHVSTWGVSSDESIMPITLIAVAHEGYQIVRDQAGYSFRYSGSVVLDMAYVAVGKIDGVLFHAIGWWDCAATIILLKEAGCIVTDAYNSSVGPHSMLLCAGRPKIHEQMLKKLKSSTFS